MTGAYTIERARQDAAFSRPVASAIPQGMIDHAPFIWSAYAVALVGLGGLVVASVLARRKVKRELDARGLERRR